MRRQGRSYVLVYVASFTVALLVHGGMFASFRRLPDSHAVITVQPGDVWVEVEFAERPRPETAKPPPPEKTVEPEPQVIQSPEPPVSDLSVEEALKPANPEPAREEEPPPQEPVPEPVEEQTRQQDDTSEPVEKTGEEEDKEEGRPAAYLRTPQEGARQVRVIGSSKPRYPVDCQRGLHRIDRKPCEGTSLWLIEVLPDGRIGEIQLVVSAGCRHLDEAVRKWLRTEARAQPAMRNGRPVREEQELSVCFHLE